VSATAWRELPSNNTPASKVQQHVDNYSLELDASWEIDVWGKIRNQKAAALANYLQS